MDVVDAAEHQIKVPAHHPVQPLQHAGIEGGHSTVDLLLGGQRRGQGVVEVDADALVVHKPHMPGFQVPAVQAHGDVAEHRGLEPHGVLQGAVEGLLLVHIPGLEHILADHGGYDIPPRALGHAAQAEIQDQSDIAGAPEDCLGQHLVVVVIVERADNQVLPDGLIIPELIEQRQILTGRGLQALDIGPDGGQHALHPVLAVDAVELPHVEVDILRPVLKGQLDDQDAAADDVGVLVEVPRVSPPDVVVQGGVRLRSGPLVVKADVLLRQGQLLVAQQLLNELDHKILYRHRRPPLFWYFQP